MYVLISYDIVKNKTRTRVMKFLKDFGDHVQLSVFECGLDEVQLQQVKEGIEELIDKKNDRVRYYSLCKACLKKIEISGWGDAPDDQRFKII